MKSFISEGKTIVDAISNALKIADYPTNFSVKIAEKEYRSFFWWQNKKAVIIFSYIPKELQKQNYKKNYKKNYNKESVLYNKKIEDNYDSPDYTSSTKIEEISSNNTNEQPKNLNEQHGRKYDHSNKEIKYDYYDKKNHMQKSYNKIKTKKNEEADDTENSVNWQTKKNMDRTYNRDLEQKKYPQKMKRNPLQSSDLGSALNGKKIFNKEKIEDKNITIENTIQEENQNKKQEINELIKIWKNEHVIFVEKWIYDLNSKLNFTKEKPEITFQENILFIKVTNFNEKKNVLKKHFYSSTVVLLYEILQNNFKDFYIKDFKIVMS